MHTLAPSLPGFDRLLILGAGGHGREAAWLARECWGEALRIEFVVDRAEYLVNEVNQIPVCLLDEHAAAVATRYLAAIGDPAGRRRAVEACESLGLRAVSLVHPRVEASQSVTLGGGSMICAGSILTVNINIGRHVHINVGCTVSHDAVIGDFSTLSPGVNIAGHVRVGRGVFIGTGACIINGSAEHPLTIGDGAVVAAGACVTRSVEPRAMVAGVPAVRKR